MNVTHLNLLTLHHNRLLVNVLPECLLRSLLQSGKLLLGFDHPLNHQLLLLHSLSPDTDPMLNQQHHKWIPNVQLLKHLTVVQRSLLAQSLVIHLENVLHDPCRVVLVISCLFVHT